MTLTPEEQSFLQQAIHLAKDHLPTGEGGPFGAVIVRGGRVIGRGVNQVTGTNDPTAHAEVMAIRAACAEAGEYHLQGATLYSSCEPCPMCLAAAYWAHVDRVIFASTRDRAAASGFDDAFIYDDLARPLPERRVRMEHCPTPESDDPFEAWDQMQDKRSY